MSESLALIEKDVFSVDTPDKFLELRRRVDFAKGFIKSIETLLDEKALEVVDKFGPIESGDMVYRITTESTYKPVMKPAQMAQEILSALAGDWDAFAACLASGAFKHGQLRKLLEESGQVERFGQFFERVEKKTVEGAPRKRVTPMNKLFAV